LLSADEAAHRILCQRAIQDESADAQAHAAAVAAAVTASLAGNAPPANANGNSKGKPEKGKPETYAAYQALQAQQLQQQPPSSKPQPQSQPRDKSPSMQARRLLFGSAAASVAPSPLASPTKRAGSFSLGVSGSTPINSKQAAAAALSPRRSSDAPEGPAALLRLNIAPRIAAPQTTSFSVAAPQGASALSSPLSGRPGQSAPASAVPTTVPASAIAGTGGATASAAGADARRLSFTRAATEHQLLHRAIASRNDSGIDSEGEDVAAAASDKASRSAAAAAPNAAPSALRNRVSAAAAFDQELPPPQWH
jgi:hypothetical protein